MTFHLEASFQAVNEICNWGEEKRRKKKNTAADRDADI